MAFQNPYQTALQVDPSKEAAVLAKLKTDPQKLAELGLAPNEDFSALKNDPVKYNKVLSFVKGEAYKGPAYSALAEGKTAPEFVESQTAGGYGQTPTDYRSSIRPGLKTQYGADEVKNEQVLGGLKTANDQAVNKYIEDMNKYIRGEVGRDVYINALNQLSSAAGTLSNTKAGFDSAYKRYQEAENMAVQGYGESRAEKIKSLEDLYSATKEMLDEEIKQQNTGVKPTQKTTPGQKPIPEQAPNQTTETPGNPMDNYKKTIINLVKGEGGQTRTDIPDIENLLNDAAKKEGWSGEQVKQLFAHLYQTADEFAKTRWNVGRFIGKN